MRIEWQRKAAEDLRAAVEFILTDNPRAAATVFRTIRSAVERLATHPEMGRVGRIANTRELVIPRLPYLVAYRIEPDTVTILRVLHTSRRWPDIAAG